ncbi:MAG: redoxin domain-containing protein [Planctomycetota bacterium]
MRSLCKSLTLLLFTVVSVFSVSGNARAAEEEGDAVLTIGSKAPELDVEHWVSDGHGKFRPVTTFESGKVYVVEFWATWCGPCIASMPHLAETQEKYADEGVQIVSISDEDIETVEKFLKRPLRKPVAQPKEGGNEKEADTEEGKEETYADLTGAYCLTTDPDRSNHAAYMEAAGQRGIPTCFIVGKAGEVEWIGHPMVMDEPLDAVLNDNWDRATFMVEFKKKQAQDLLMTKITRLVRAKDFEGALGLIQTAKNEAGEDQQALTSLLRMEAQVYLLPIREKLMDDEQAEDAQKELMELVKKAPADVAGQIRSMSVSLLMSVQKPDVAAALLSELASMEQVVAGDLNELAWSIYLQAQRNKQFPEEILNGAVAIAEKAVAAEPGNSMILDTLAHLVYLRGDLDRAIELQTKAVEEPGEGITVNDEMKSFLEQLKKEKAQN